MLELIFQGYVEWIYGLVLEAWEYFSSVLLDLMSLDFQYLRSHMPIIDTVMQIMLAVGWALLIGNLVFQAVKSMASGLGFEAEDPKLLFTRTFVFSFLLLASPQICQIGLNMTSTIIDMLEMPDAVNITFADDASFGGLAASWLLVIIFGIIIMFQTFKLILEMAERYFVLALLTITAPLAFGMGGSRNTSDIFTGWCRMFASMCVLMVMNVVFMKMLLSVLSFYPSGLDVLPWMVLVVTIVKVAKKADSILSRIGLNPAMTGDPLGRGLPGALSYTVIRNMASNVAKTIGKGGSGGTAGAHSGSTNPRGGPSGTHTGAAAGNPQNRNYSSASAQSNTRSTVSQEAGQPQSTQAGTSVQQDTSQNSNLTNASAVSSTAQGPQNSIHKQSSRNTSVPKGRHRGTSHVKPQNTTKHAASNTIQQSTSRQNTQSVHSTASQQNQAPSVLGATAAMAADTVLQGASAVMRNTPHPSPGAAGSTYHGSPSINAAKAPNKQAVPQHNRTAKQNAVLNSTHTQAQQTAQNSHSAENQSIPGTAPQEHPTTPYAAPAGNGVPVQAGIASVPNPQSTQNTAKVGIAGTEQPAAPAASRSTSAAPSIGGRYTQQETQSIHAAQHNQSAAAKQQTKQDTAHNSEAHSTNREQAVSRGTVAEVTRPAVQNPVAPHAVSAPPVRTDGTKPAETGNGIHAQPEHRSTQRVSAAHSTQTSKQDRDAVPTGTQPSGVSSELRSTQRPATTPIPAGQSPAIPHSSQIKQQVGATASAGVHDAHTSTELRSSQRQATPASPENRTPQHSTGSISSPNGTQAASVRSDVRSTQRPSTTVSQESHSPVAAVQNSSVTQNVQTEQRSTQQPAAAQNLHHPAAMTPGISAGVTAPAATEQRSTQRTPAAAPQEGQLPHNHPVGTSAPATQSPNLPAEQRSTQRPAVQTTGTIPSIQEPRASTRPAQPQQTVPTHSPSTNTAPQEQRSTQKPLQATPTQANVPIPAAAPHSVASSGDTPQSAQQGRNPAPASTAGLHTEGQTTASTRQESRPAARAAVSPPAARPTPTAQQEQPPHRMQSVFQREPTSVSHPGMAGMAAPPTQAAPGTQAIPAKQEPGSAFKKTFVPLSGRQPESIPSHLDLKQEPQKTTKRPDRKEGSDHVTE